MLLLLSSGGGWEASGLTACPPSPPDDRACFPKQEEEGEEGRRLSLSWRRERRGGRQGRLPHHPTRLLSEETYCVCVPPFCTCFYLPLSHPAPPFSLSVCTAASLYSLFMLLPPSCCCASASQAVTAARLACTRLKSMPPTVWTSSLMPCTHTHPHPSWLKHFLHCERPSLSPLTACEPWPWWRGTDF